MEVSQTGQRNPCVSPEYLRGYPSAYRNHGDVLGKRLSGTDVLVGESLCLRESDLERVINWVSGNRKVVN